MRDYGLLDSALYSKRVAFCASDVFLRMSGWRIEVDADDARAFLIGLLERRECDLAHLLPWLSDHLTPS